MKTALTFLAFLCMTFFVACSDKDYYDPDYQTIPDNLSDLNVPAGFDWTTSSQYEINFNVDDQLNGAYYYKVQVFDKNPIISSDALLLAEGLAKKNEPFKGKVTHSKSDSILYIQQTTPSGERLVSSIYVSNEVKTTYLNTTKSGATVKSGANIEYTTPTRFYNTPSNAIVISGNSNYSTFVDNGVYVIPAGQTFEHEINNGSYKDIVVYIEGTWKNPSTYTSLNKMKLIIQDGGKYIPTQEVSSMMVNSGSKIVVASSGSFNPENKTINISMNNEDNAQIINNSSVFKANNISDLKEIYNYGTIALSGTLSSNTSGVKIINESSFTAQNLSLNGGNIINTCKFVVNETANLKYNTTLNIGADKLFKSKVLLMGQNNTIALDPHSILDVTDELQFENTQNYINGPESGNKALLRLEKFTVNGWTRPTFSGYLQIESSNYPENLQATTYNLPQDAKYVDFVRKGESTVNISANECNGGGNSPRNSDPNDITYPLDVVLGTTYTYAFEDNYPNIGDYDMNDFVLDINLSYTMPATNKASKLTIQTKVRAVGATKRLAAAIQLDGILSGNVKSISAPNTTFKGDIFTITNGLEKNQDYVVIPITDDAHALFGVSSSEIVNTEINKSYLPAKDLVFEIAFNEPIDISSTSLVDMLNVFIINGGYNTSNRKEVHLRGYNATQKASDVSSGKNYSTSNFVYGIRVPKSFKYAVEWTEITKAYPLFKAWVSVNGQVNPDWYNTYETDKVYLLEK